MASGGVDLCVCVCVCVKEDKMLTHKTKYVVSFTNITIKSNSGTFITYTHTQNEVCNNNEMYSSNTLISHNKL